jgi:ribose-phosphate pyrophosphokinase
MGAVATRRFPDGETYVRLLCDPRGRAVDVVCTLTRPDQRFLPLAFVADAVRDLGAREVNLVAPYLAYMRQDARFRPGEAVTCRTFARLVSSTFDRLVTVDPHLHRNPDLAALYSIPTKVLSAAPAIAAWIASNVAHPLIIGPDAESEQWTARVGALSGAPHLILTKQRLGDRQVRVTASDLSAWRGFHPVLVDDVASSGRTLAAAARVLTDQGLQRPVCVVTHAIFAGDAHGALSTVADSIVSTDSVPHPSNAIGLAPLIASAL